MTTYFNQAIGGGYIFGFNFAQGIFRDSKPGGLHILDLLGEYSRDSELGGGVHIGFEFFQGTFDLAAMPKSGGVLDKKMSST